MAEEMTVVSVRVPVAFRDQLAEAAQLRKLSTSDLIRQALQMLLSTPIGWRCEHFSVMADPMVVKWDGCQAGCTMRPIFHRSEVELTDA